MTCDPTFRLEHGNKYPYDAPDDWEVTTPLPPIDRAHATARGIIADLTDRSGIKHGFSDIDQGIRVDIVEDLASIIRAGMDLPEPEKPEVMTLRDQFAMSALMGLLTTPHLYKTKASPRKAVVCNAYQLADDMLEARK